MTDNFRILPDIFWGENISITPFFFSAQKLMIAIPPEGECLTEVLFVERYSYAPYVEYKDGFHEKVEFNPRRLLGLSDSVIKRLKEDPDLEVVEWEMRNFVKRKPFELGIPITLTPEKILQIGPHHEGITISEQKKKWLVAIYNWAYLLNDSRFDFDKCVIENIPEDLDSSSSISNSSLMNLLAEEAFKLSIPDLDSLNICEALDIRNEFKKYFNPFWRTIQRLQYDIGQAIIYDKSITSKSLKDISEKSIKNNLGLTLEGWTEELNSNLYKVDSIKYLKKFSKLFLDVLTGILKKDLSKLVGGFIDFPDEIKTPSQTIDSDFDKTIKFLYYLKNKKNH